MNRRLRLATLVIGTTFAAAATAANSPPAPAGASGEFLKTKAECDAGDSHACSNLGWMYDGGVGVHRDRGAGAALFKMACDQKVAAGCDNLAWDYRKGAGVPEDATKAAQLFALACKLGDDDGCREGPPPPRSRTDLDECVVEGSQSYRVCVYMGGEEAESCNRSTTVTTRSRVVLENDCEFPIAFDTASMWDRSTVSLEPGQSYTLPKETSFTAIRRVK